MIEIRGVIQDKTLCVVYSSILLSAICNSTIVSERNKVRLEAKDVRVESNLRIMCLVTNLYKIAINSHRIIIILLILKISYCIFAGQSNIWYQQWKRH